MIFITKNAIAALRAFYAIAQVPYQEIEANGLHREDRFPTLSTYHSTSPTLLGSALLEVWNYFFLPKILGFRVGRFGLNFLFLFGEDVRQRPPVFPTDWLAILRSQASFAEEPLSDQEFYDALRDPAGPGGAIAAFRTFIHNVSLSMDDQLSFLRSFIDSLNSFFFEVTDLANFTQDGDPEKPIDPIAAFEHYLTIDRLVRRTIASMSLSDTGSAKGSVFEVADLFDTLSMRFGHTRSGSVFFKSLFQSHSAPKLLCDRFSRLPAPLGPYLCEITNQCYDQLRLTIRESIWLKSKLVGDNVMVRDKTLTAERPESVESFVANVMRAFRNGHHGYFSSEDEPRPSRYLFLVDGTVPDCITGLPSLWLLAYLMDPGIVGWKPLRVSAYD